MMKDLQSPKNPFPFILEELESLRPTVKKVFGFTHVYLAEKLLCSLRDASTHQGSNGMWLYTTIEHVDSLGGEFIDLPRRQLWRSGKNAWVILASRLENFEENAFRACELILRGDPRIGRVSRRMLHRGERARTSVDDSKGKRTFFQSTC